ncbi:MAG TPA: formimidoylglutamate deiminase [Acidobacteriaceae bacterium]|jgi:formimidoylglutamate deiminase|nr:formimidoylglutamate deiminase [Acidobacteriaceae bacterium]
MSVFYRPDLIYVGDRFVPGAGVRVEDGGRVLAVGSAAGPGDQVVDLAGKALLPGFVNAHSHAFQRLIRGRAESRVVAGRDFWSWRGTMYRAAARLDPQQVYDVARMAFLEMTLAGTTTVGEFHYLHNAPGGRPYDDPNLLAKQVIAAAQSVGLRVVLLRCAYLRSGYQVPLDPGQIRFFETTADFLARCEELTTEYSAHQPLVQFGIAPHSVRAVPFDDLREIVGWALGRKLPLHMHLSEQVAENEACVREYGRTPVSLLGEAGMLGSGLTAVHATHITDHEIALLAQAGAVVCACPTTERNLGDGIVAADRLLESDIPIAFGSDSQAQIDPLEDARELDYHLRLSHQERAILDGIGGQGLAARLFQCATANGARALGVRASALGIGEAADFFTVDLRDVSIAGNSSADLLSLIVFGMNRTAIRDVAVNGRLVVRDGRHPLQEEIVLRYAELHAQIWRDADGGSR